MKVREGLSCSRGEGCCTDRVGYRRLVRPVGVCGSCPCWHISPCAGVGIDTDTAAAAALEAAEERHRRPSRKKRSVLSWTLSVPGLIPNACAHPLVVSRLTRFAQSHLRLNVRGQCDVYGAYVSSVLQNYALPCLYCSTVSCIVLTTAL